MRVNAAICTLVGYAEIAKIPMATVKSPMPVELGFGVTADEVLRAFGAEVMTVSLQMAAGRNVSFAHT